MWLSTQPISASATRPRSLWPAEVGGLQGEGRGGFRTAACELRGVRRGAGPAFRWVPGNWSHWMGKQWSPERTVPPSQAGRVLGQAPDPDFFLWSRWAGLEVSHLLKALPLSLAFWPYEPQDLEAPGLYPAGLSAGAALLSAPLCDRSRKGRGFEVTVTWFESPSE